MCLAQRVQFQRFAQASRRCSLLRSREMIQHLVRCRERSRKVFPWTLGENGRRKISIITRELRLYDGVFLSSITPRSNKCRINVQLMNLRWRYYTIATFPIAMLARNTHLSRHESTHRSYSIYRVVLSIEETQSRCVL